jgi:hypothetical protein
MFLISIITGVPDSYSRSPNPDRVLDDNIFLRKSAVEKMDNFPKKDVRDLGKAFSPPIGSSKK